MAVLQGQYADVAMIDQNSLTLLLRRSIPDAQVIRLDDLTGGGDHLSVHIRSNAFAGLTLLDQHRLVYSAVDDAMRDGRIHALQIKTEVLETSR